MEFSKARLIGQIGFHPVGLLLAGMAIAGCFERTAIAQQGAAVSGRVLDPAGRPVANAIVAAHTVAPKLISRRLPIITGWRASLTTTAQDGTYTLPGIPAGDYFICADAPGTTLLSPCRWSATIAPVTVKANDTVVNAGPLVMIRGYDLNIHISYPPSFRQTPAAVQALQTLSVGVWQTNVRRFDPALLISETDAGRTHKITVPIDATFRVGVHADGIQIKDFSGASINTALAAPSIYVPTSTGTQLVNYAVIGMAAGK